MKCDSCDQEATVFLTQIINGKMTQVNLCEECSREKGVTDPKGFQLADFLLNTPTPLASSKTASTNDEVRACKACGFTKNDLKTIGRLGCPECYKVFRDDLDLMLRAMHKGTKHVGKTPGQHLHFEENETSPLEASAPIPKPLTAADIEVRIEKLKADIERAIDAERYEDAARLRDEIKALQAEQP